LALGIAFCVAGAQFKDYGGAEILAVFNFIALMIGLILVVAGGIYFIYATTYVVRAPKEAKIGCLVPYIVAAVLIALGVVTLVLIWNSNELMKLIFVIAGIILLVVGALYLISGILELLGKGGKEEVVAEATVEETTAE
nr:hypothetical protein [Bacilli bacterium]